MHEQKRRILILLVESAKEKKLDSLMAAHNQHEPLTQNDEAKIISSLSRKIEAIEADHQQHENLFAYRRLRRKLELRKLKRKKHLKLFDIDSYVNELIDREKDAIKQRLNSEGNTENEAILFETDEAIKSSLDMNENSDCEIVAIKRVLDRFKFKNFIKPAQFDFNYKNVITMPIGLVEKRNDDVKCVLSPFTNKVLKPYVRRDFESLPDKLLLNSEIINKANHVKFDRHSIDYVHLRPEHVFQINSQLEQHFWSGIDISECLQYLDYTLVALYRKLIVGFAFLVPNAAHNESYLSFIFVHPDWRNSDKNCLNTNISIAQYMLYYLIRVNEEFDVTLHVSVNSPAVIFYQKFGFKIEEYIKNFYDKYYSDTQNFNKDAFLMRLSRT